MSIRLEANLTERLLGQPESGMGYQIVEVTRKSQRFAEKGIVFNAEYLLYIEEKELEKLSEIEDFDKIQRTASRTTDIIDLKVIPRDKIGKASMLRDSAASYSAEMSSVELTKFNEKFKRFSAFQNDRRRNPDGSLKPKTYATTEEDAKNVKTGIEAVRRYALPNPAPAIYVFTISPPAKTEIKKGTVQPQYDQPGGGVEVIFIYGSPSGTVTGLNIIPAR